MGVYTRPANIPEGKRYGRWTIVHEVAKTRPKKRRFLCRCDCGNEKELNLAVLTSGLSSSCGCFQKERLKVMNATHGMCSTPEYRSWSLMKNRCTNPKDTFYSRYGGRGIKVCSEWMNSFEQFFAHLGPKPSPKHLLDRINNDGNYEPGNCRWATPVESSRNRRSNTWIICNGEKHTIAEWAHITGLSPLRIAARRRAGWPVERLFVPPMKPGGGPNGWHDDNS